MNIAIYPRKSKKDDMKKVMVTIYTNASQTNIHTAIRILAKIVGAKMIEIMQIESELPEIKKSSVMLLKK